MALDFDRKDLTMKYTVKEFAKEIRNLYPSDYDDLTDENLVELWIKKFPNDREKIEFSQNHRNQNAESHVSFGFVKYLFWIGLIVGGAYLFYKYGHNLESSLNNISLQTMDRGSSTLSTNQNDPLTTFNNIQIDKEISAYVDTNKYVACLKLDENLKMELKRILSDPNPDPENKSGTSCEQTERKCKWCSNVFYVDGTYTTIYRNVKNYIQPENFLTAYAAALAVGFGSEQVKDELTAYCNSYKNGERYCNSYSNQEFCSERCMREYKLYH